MDCCANVYVSKDIKTFSLKCTLCKKDIHQWDDFVQHMQSFHNPAHEIDPLMESNVAINLDAVDPPKSQIELDLHFTKDNIKQEDQPAAPVDDDDEDSNLDIKDESVDDPVYSPVHSTSSEDSDSESDSQTEKKFALLFYRRNKPTTEFIEFYKSQPCLWDPSNEDYKNFPLRTEALQHIIDNMKKRFNVNINERVLKFAIKKLRKQYYNTLQQLKDTTTSAKVTEVVQDYFERMSFLSVLNDYPEEIRKENDSMKYLVFGSKFNEITLAFIEAYASFPALYDPNHMDYNNYNVRRWAYGEMVKCLKDQHSIVFTEDEIYKGIYNLRQWYYKIQERVQSSTDAASAALSDAQQIYIDKCHFLPPKLVKKKLSCEVCGKISNNELTLQGHMFREHQIGQWPYKCPDCERSFQHKSTLQAHQKRKHVGKVHQCEYCERRFAVLTDLQRHVRVHTGEKPFVCELCGKAFRSKAQLGYHSDAIHTKTRAFKCTMCPKDFLKRRDLKDHIKAHLNIRDKICETCGKAFTNCHSLIRHRQIHSEVKKFECKLCDAKFHQFVGLNAHMKRTHNIVKNKPKP